MKDNNKIPQDLYNALYIRYADTVLCFSDDPELLLLKRKQFWDSIQAVYGKEIYYRKLYQALWYKFKKQQRSTVFLVVYIIVYIICIIILDNLIESYYNS